jgi:hypothetical protein
MAKPADARARFVVQAGTKVAQFLASNAFVNIIEGPLGSGKTDALLVKLMRHAQEQRRSPVDGIRRTRFAIIRNTTVDLKRSTIKSWTERFPPEVYGVMKIGAPMHHDIKFGDVEMEVDFIGLDKDEDIRKLRSTQYTRIAFDELEFIKKSLFDEARQRLRYPAEVHGGPTCPGVDAATNAPPEDHWLPIMTGRVEFPLGLSDEEVAALVWPEDGGDYGPWRHYLQPPALIEEFDQHGNVAGYKVNPGAENLANLPTKGNGDYYRNMLPSLTRSQIDSRLMVRTVLVADGSAVWPMFRREVYVSRETLKPRSLYPVFIGLDYGRSPAAVFIQQINNRVLVQHELIGHEEGAEIFAPKVKRFLAQHYPDSEVIAYGDPKGNDQTQSSERTAVDIFRFHGIIVRSPPGLVHNDIDTRVMAVAHLLNEMSDARPRLMISPVCRKLIVAMCGRYCNERVAQGELKPKKDHYADVCDALQYIVLGMGEGRAMIGLRPIGELRGVKVWHHRKSMRRLEA